jgi:MATE family multidrug resistance protein
MWLWRSDTQPSGRYLIVMSLGQVLGLFVVGIGEYGAVWLGTDWDKEVQRGRERNLLEAKRQALRTGQTEESQQQRIV